MSTKNPSFPKSNFLTKHHSFLVLSNNGAGFLESFLDSQLNFKIQGNPDFWQKEIETFGIEDSRELKEVHLRKSFKTNGEKIFIVKTKFITHEAQNALLKVLEDPQPNSFFFFILPEKDNLIPTLTSRFFVLEEKKDVNSTKLDFEIPFFLKLSPAARIKTLSKIIDEKSKKLALEFLNQLEKTLRENVDWKKISNEEKEIFDLIGQSQSYLKSAGASLKMILENICLFIPKK